MILDLRLAMRRVWFIACGLYIGSGFGLILNPGVQALRIFAFLGIEAGLMSVILVLLARQEMKEPKEEKPVG